MKVRLHNIPEVFRAITALFPEAEQTTGKRTSLKKVTIKKNVTTVITYIEGRVLVAIYSIKYADGNRPYFTLNSHGRSHLGHLRGSDTSQQVWQARLRRGAHTMVKSGNLPLHDVTKIASIFGDEFYTKISNSETAELIRRYGVKMPTPEQSTMMA